MYTAGLSHTQLTDYLGLIVESGLVGYEQESRLYFLKDNGLRYMTAFDEIKELLAPVKMESQLLAIVR